jgi:hypothetical protein
MKRRGRPQLPKLKRKSVMLCARTDQQSYNILRRAAERADMKFTDWVRDRLRSAAEREIAA